MAPNFFLLDGQLGVASVLALLLPLFLTYVLLLRRWKHKGSVQRRPPGPWQLPIIGNLHQLGALPHRSLHLLSQKHGPLMFLKLGQLPTYVVSSATVAREILKTHDPVFASRPRLAAFGVFGFGFSDVTFQPYTEAWRHSRRLFVGNFSGPKKAQSFQSVRDEEVGLLVDAISRSTGPVNLSHLVHSLNNNIICRIALGKKFNEYGQKGRFYDTFKAARELLGGFSLGDVFPSIKWVDWLTGRQLKLRKSFHGLDSFLDEALGVHTDPQRRSEEKDFVDVLLEAQKDEGQEIPLTTNRIKGLLFNVVLGGSDTSSAPVVWAMAELMRRPQVMKRVQDELRHKIKGKDKVEGSDLEQLELLKLVVKETLRLHPSLPMLVPRISMGECSIDGYTIPDKAVVIVNAWTIGRDPNSWENPGEFQPERFMNSSIDYKGQDFEFIPFSSGRRMCPGLYMALAVIELALANLLYCFDWSFPSGLSANDMDMSESPGIIVHKKCELVLIAHPYAASK
ncbi:cytochrome P450 71A9-like [Nymphaea colorata]|nr:cytochrome P450 71A9-like [Nymphaea colorata]